MLVPQETTSAAPDGTLLLIGVLAGLAIVGAFAVALMSMTLRSRARERAHRERMVLAEKGLDIPAELYALERPPSESLRGLRIVLVVLGVVLVLSGIGAMVALAAEDGLRGVLNGTAPLLLGLAMLISERVVARVFARSDAPGGDGNASEVDAASDAVSGPGTDSGGDAGGREADKSGFATPTGIVLVAAVSLLVGGAPLLAGRVSQGPTSRAVPPGGVPRLVAAMPHRLVPDPAPQRIDSLLRTVYPSDRPGAAVVAVVDGEVLVRSAYGLADAELDVPLSPSSVFGLGSMTKPFTALGVLTLAADGKLNLDDPIDRFLPDYPQPRGSITLRHLLSHTSGIANYTELETWRGRIREDLDPTELIALFADAPPDFPPGGEWRYSNSGYALLATVIERVSGDTYEEYLRRRIFEPLGMEHTRSGSATDLIDGRAKGYEVRDGQIRNARFMSLSHTWGGGGLFSTVDDLARWHRALAAGDLLPPPLMRAYLTPAQLSTGDRADYALGWFVGRLQGAPMLYHGGGIYGYVGHMVWLPTERVFVALLSNRVDPEADKATRQVAERVAALAMGRPIEAAEREAVQVPAEQLRRLVGTYRIDGPTGGTAHRRILLEDGWLYYDTGARRVRILPSSPTEFFAEGAAATLEFEIDDRGMATGFVVRSGGGGEVRAVRVP
jgi:CubicO group peptidase (beta-lactamase class C family)